MVTHPDGSADAILLGENDGLRVNRIRAGQKSHFDWQATDRTEIDDSTGPHPKAAPLAMNSAESQRRLRAGLGGLAERFKAERDQYIRRGWRNVAAEAVEVRASGTRDDRFRPENLVDGKSWEMPVDGVVDHTLGSIETTGNGGYGRGPVPYLLG